MSWNINNNSAAKFAREQGDGAAAKATELEQRVDTAIAAGTIDLEVKDARGEHVNLRSRLDDHASQLAETTTEIDNIKAVSLQNRLNSRITTPTKKLETFVDGMFNLDATSNINVVDGSVVGTKQLTITGTTSLPSNTNVAIYNVINNVRGFEIELEPMTSSSQIKLGFANNTKNFIFINFSSGELYLVTNGVLDSTPLSTSILTTFNAGDRFKLILHGNTIQLFKNGVLHETFKNETVRKMLDLGKNYPAIVFRDGTSTYKYGINKLKVYQKTYPKFMHLSCDDFIYTLKDLNTKLPASLFEHSVFAFLKRLHDTYGAVFTLNVFYVDGTFNLSNMTNYYAAEFRANADWLRFAFHGYDGVVDYSTLDSATAKTHYDTIMNEIKRFAGVENIDTIPRTSMFKGSLVNCQAWRDTTYGVAGFLAADDDRTNNLYLGTKAIDSLKACNDLYDEVEKLYFLRTDLRLDNEITPYLTLDSRKTNPIYRGQQNAQIIFWHDTGNYTQSLYDRIEDCCKWARDNGYVFLYPMDVNPKF